MDSTHSILWLDSGVAYYILWFLVFWLGAGGAVDGPASRGADMLASEPVTTPSPARRGKAAGGSTDPPSFQGWHTTDGQEIERRRWRGRTEVVAVEALEPDREFFGSFRVRAASGNDYTVEIRSLDGLENSCDCLDHRVNGLGTCKHIEGTLGALRRGRARAFAKAARRGSPRVEIYLSRHGDPAVRAGWPVGDGAAARRVLAPFLSNGAALSGASMATLEAVKQAVAAAPEEVRDLIRVSRHLRAWIDEQRRRTARDDDRKRFLAGLARGGDGLDLLRHRLLPYQRDGVLHLAFGERALLADEMGLGKTVQAIGACELLRRRRGIRRVLVVCPASLKAEWAEQIARFSDLSACVVRGTRANRLRDYRGSAFFYLANYEQIIPDRADINEILSPDVVILDEAQRIKNWQTKTARAVKGLRSPCAFILTGTPLENRIDEIYSIVQYLDPGLLGPLFKFNRDFYRLDERGRRVDYRNLEALHRRLKPVMLRRRKSDVEDQLPARTVRNYFVAMADEQRQRYQEYEARVARAVGPFAPARTEKGGIRPAAEVARLYAHAVRHALYPGSGLPRQPEAGRTGAPAPGYPGRAGTQDHRVLGMGADAGNGPGSGPRAGPGLRLAHGSVPQDRRRAEIQRFKKDPRLPAVPVHRFGEPGTEPPGRQRGDQSGSAVEPGQAGTTDRTRLAQVSDPGGQCHQPGVRGLHRAPDAAPVVAEEGSGRRGSRWRRRPRGNSHAVGPRRLPATVGSDDGGCPGDGGRGGDGGAR